MGNHEVNCRLCGEDLRGLHGGHAVGCDGNTYTQPQTKYPGADTSKERLKKIEAAYNFNVDLHHEEKRSRPMIRDLLAMIEERDAALRWRVTAEEMPPEDTKVLVNENGNLSEEWQFEFAKWNKQYDDSIRWVETREFMHIDQPKLWRPL